MRKLKQFQKSWKRVKKKNKKNNCFDDTDEIIIDEKQRYQMLNEIKINMV